MAVGKTKSFFDQYSVICVFGSVVGCVVVPLITQSVESLIFSAIVVTLTARTLRQRMLAASNENPPRDERRKNKEKEEKKVKTRKIVKAQSLDLDQVRRQREEDLKKQEELREAEKERRQEERKEKKVRKREERLKRKEEEKKEKEFEEQQRRERQETRIQRKQREVRESRNYPFTFPTVESLSEIESVAHQRPIRHERKHSSSSSTSSTSTRSQPHPSPHTRHPVRASSDPSLLPRARSPPQTKTWQTLPSPQVPPRWNPGSNSQRLRKEDSNDSSRFSSSNPPASLYQHHGNSTVTSSQNYTSSPAPLWVHQGLGSAFWSTYGQAAILNSHSFEAFGNPALNWMSSVPMNMASTTGLPGQPNLYSHPPTEYFTGNLESIGTGRDGYYSLFSDGVSPFGASLLSSSSPTETSCAATQVPAAASDTPAPPAPPPPPPPPQQQEFDDWPVL